MSLSTLPLLTAAITWVPPARMHTQALPSGEHCLQLRLPWALPTSGCWAWSSFSLHPALAGPGTWSVGVPGSLGAGAFLRAPLVTIPADTAGATAGREMGLGWAEPVGAQGWGLQLPEHWRLVETC